MSLTATNQRDDLKTAQHDNLKMKNPETPIAMPAANVATSLEALEQPQEFDQALEDTLSEWDSAGDDAAFKDLA